MPRKKQLLISALIAGCFYLYVFHFNGFSAEDSTEGSSIVLEKNDEFNVTDTSNSSITTVKTALPSATTTISTSSARPGISITSDAFEPGFAINGSSLCPDNGEDVEVAILITSAPYHFAQREAIRLTWGHFSRRKGITIAFLLGKTLNSSTAAKVNSENSLYEDIIVANIIDSYDNLTLKTLSAFDWVNKFCNRSDFVLKTDDDVFINIPNLLNFIASHKRGEEAVEPTIYGSLAKKWKPFRVKSSKYYVSKEQYSGRVFPDFTTGPAYLFDPFVAQSLFTKALKKPYLKLEDVFLTGIVAEEANIKRQDVYEFGSEKLKLTKTGFCVLMKLISIHEVAYHQQFELWRRLFDKRSDCEKV